VKFDYVLVGGGLQNALLTLALRERQPQATIALVERAKLLAGNHTWSFHAGDVPPTARSWVEPLVRRHWPAYDVRFPSLRRTLSHGYSTIPSSRVDALVRERLATAPGSQLFVGAEVARASAHEVGLADGRTIEGTLVVDARGPEVLATGSRGGWQKFLGLELELARPSGLERPLVMDATVPQRDGFRFMYVLPLAEDRLLVEDTTFSDSPRLDKEALRERVHEYARAQGWDVLRVAREETGLLPLPWGGALPEPKASPLVGGYQGGWFHPTTGYSLPVAVRLAEIVAAVPPEQAFSRALEDFARRHRSQARYAWLLNWLLFCAYPPDERWHILERFYRLPEPTIERFYALQMTAADRARLLLGRPPRGFSVRAAWARLQIA
jgi:lycopene beta-cyclase